MRLWYLFLFNYHYFPKNGSLVKNNIQSTIRFFFLKEEIKTKGKFRLISKMKTKNVNTEIHAINLCITTQDRVQIEI